LLLATAVFNLFSLLPDEAFRNWGWRLPFLLGIALLGIGLFIRLQVLESPLFAQLRLRKQQAGLPIVDLLRRYPRNVLLAMGARFAENGAFYIFTVFVLTYATLKLEVARSSILNSVLIASAVHFVAIPAWGLLSDRVGRRPVYLTGAASLAAFAFPFFWLVDTGSPLCICLAIAIGLVLQAAMYAPQAAFFSELFGTQVRYTGASIGYQLAAPFSGGLAPLICLALFEWADGSPWPIALYMIGLSLITLVSVWIAAETHRSHLIEHDAVDG
jgi:MFS family permease